MRHYRGLLWQIFLGCTFSLLMCATGCKKEQNEPVGECEILISGMSEYELESKGIEEGLQKDGNSVVEGRAGFETHRHSVEDIRIAAYMEALCKISETINTSVRASKVQESDNPKSSSKSLITRSELAFGECVITSASHMLQESEDGDDGAFKREIEFSKGHDLLYRFSYEEPKGGGEVVSLKNKLKLGELMKLLAASKYTVKVISERAILEGRGDLKKDGGIDEVAKFNAVEGGSVAFVVVLDVSGIEVYEKE